MDFSITKTWDGKSFEHPPIAVQLETAGDKGVSVVVNSPFFDDPGNPGGTPGQPFLNLWDFEVVEVFFLNDHSQYLEVEFCPYGQHIVLLLKGFRDPFKDKLPLEFMSVIDDKTWQGQAYIPSSYFPPKVSKFNAYAIHGSGSKRIYEALYPAPADTNNIHRLEYFQSIDFANLLPENWTSAYSSEEWKDVLKT